MTFLWRGNIWYPFTDFLCGLVIIICYPQDSCKILLSTHTEKILHPLKNKTKQNDAMKKASLENKKECLEILNDCQK